MCLRAIKTEGDYNEAINELEQLISLHPAPKSKESDKLEVLAILIKNYEDRNFKFDLPDPITAVKFVMDQRNLKQDDLIPFFGSRSGVSGFLSGKRELSKKVMQKLHKEFKIPAEILLQKPSDKTIKRTKIQQKKIHTVDMV
ncbi:MAG: hypothetical protein P9X24_17225 [Candidatus Hatepunaea meridiana]|nr:hypothetical protein [Candidatus Hatepunaea meridiana]